MLETVKDGERDQFLIGIYFIQKLMTRVKAEGKAHRTQFMDNSKRKS